MTTTIFTVASFDSTVLTDTYSVRNVITVTGNGQGKLRVTFLAGASGLITADNVSIGISTGTNADTTATPVPLKFAGASGFTIGFRGTITSDWVSLSGFTSSNKLVVIYDTTTLGNGGAAQNTVLTNSDSYFSDGVASYNLSTTPVGFIHDTSNNFGVMTVEVDPIDGYDQTLDDPPARKFAEKLKAAAMVAALAVPQLTPALFPGSSTGLHSIEWMRELVYPQANFKDKRDATYRVAQQAGPLVRDLTVEGTGDFYSADSKSSVTYKKWIVYQDYVRPPYVPSLGNKTNEWQSEFVYPGSNFRSQRDARYGVAQRSGFIDFNREFIPSTLNVDQVKSSVSYRKWFIYDDQFEPTRVPDTATRTWYTQWSEPRRAPRPVAFQQSFIDPVPEVTSLAKWFHPLDEPQRQPRRAAFFQAAFLVEAAPFPERVDVTKWARPFSEPQRFRPALQTTEQPFLFAEPFPEELAQLEWFRPFSEPRRALRSVVLGPEPSFTFMGAAAALEAVHIQWIGPDSEVFYTRVTQYPDYFESPSGDPERVDAAKWLPTESTVIAKRQIQYQSITQPVGAPPVVALAVQLPDKWYKPFSEPQRVPRREAFFQANFYVGAAPFGERVDLTKWYRPFSEPTRRIPRLATDVQQVIIQQQLSPIVSFSTLAVDVTFTSVTQYPVKSFYVEAAPFAERVEIGKWLQPLSEPTRRLMLPTPEQQTFTKPELTQEQIGIELRHWFMPLAEPTRRLMLPVSEQQFTARTEIIIPKFFEQPFSEPVRYHLSVPAYQQQYLIYLDQFGLYGSGAATDTSTVIGIGRLIGTNVGIGKSGLVQILGSKGHTGITGGKAFTQITTGKGKPTVKRDP